MTYQETLAYLYNSAPLFQHIGKAAYKEGLENTLALDEYFGHPHKKFRSIHVAGTNGKGSCSHTLAAILQSAGYRVGLYTSPHLVDFRERIRINGIPVSQDFVIDFVEKHRSFFEPLHPSFFELTTAMAFHYFACQQVDVAVIEVGLGGRLDCTNIIHPDLCLITNISFDHVQFLGNTLEKIAGEKAGIIKSSVPVVIGETTPETKSVFQHKAAEVNAPIIFAEEEHLLTDIFQDEDGKYTYQTRVKIVKNKVAPPFRKAEFDIMFGEGISRSGEIIDLGAELGIIKKSGSWYSYNETKLGQGRDAAKQCIQDNPELAEELEGLIFTALKDKE